MKKNILIALAALSLFTGCAGFHEKYKEQVWTPDGFNYTIQRDRRSGDLSDYWGLSWNLK